MLYKCKISYLKSLYLGNKFCKHSCCKKWSIHGEKKHGARSVFHSRGNFTVICFIYIFWFAWDARTSDLLHCTELECLTGFSTTREEDIRTDTANRIKMNYLTCFLINGPIVILNIVANVFYIFCMVCPLHRERIVS